MTDTGHRTYAVAIALVVFFFSWATIAAHPWAATAPDPRLAALQVREQRLRADARLVTRIVDRRNAAYRVALRARRTAIANATRSQAALAAVQAPQVRIVTLPALTSTRTS